MTKANPFRFSTKYQDDESDLVYYGYRYYSASTGRWVSRDPKEEKGGINLYALVKNKPVSAYDPLGLSCEDPCGQAKKQRIDKGNPGGTVCCEGAKYACVWDPTGDPAAQSDGGKRIAAKCTKAHEDYHLKDPRVKCGPGPGCGMGVTMASGGKASECDAYKAEMACYDASDCAGDPQCIKDVDAMKKTAQMGIDDNCGKK